jgi:hypothetical protein
MIAAIDGASVEDATDALLSITYHDSDWKWVEGILVAHLDERSHTQIRSLAITCLGHLARIHRTIDSEIVVPRLRGLVHDRELGGVAEDALSDIRRFVA